MTKRSSRFTGSPPPDPSCGPIRVSGLAPPRPDKPNPSLCAASDCCRLLETSYHEVDTPSVPTPNRSSLLPGHLGGGHLFPVPVALNHFLRLSHLEFWACFLLHICTCPSGSSVEGPTVTRPSCGPRTESPSHFLDLAVSYLFSLVFSLCLLAPYHQHPDTLSSLPLVKTKNKQSHALSPSLSSHTC